MTAKNSLLEFIEQTRRIQKSVDMICNQTIDSIIEALPYIERKTIYGNRKFFDRFCKYYHKDNPLVLYRRIKKSNRPDCFVCKRGSSVKYLNRYVQSSINRCWQGIDMVEVAWAEIVDFMWERPELIDPHLIGNDDYLQARIAEVCKRMHKRNPLKNGMWAHFGKHWINEDGEWMPERRQKWR